MVIEFVCDEAIQTANGRVKVAYSFATTHVTA